MDRLASATRWLFDSEHGAIDRFVPRWLFLRALGCIYFSAFFSLVFQIRGLIGPEGILPANEYLYAVVHSFGYSRGIWFAPTLLWLSSGPNMLIALCWVGMGASLLLALNAWPRRMLVICFVCFLSFVSAAQDFSGYQSDGMLLEAGFIALFFAPSGFRPGFGIASPPSRASLLLLQWEWFRIYFESGVAKIIGGDPEWRHFTAMDEYYQNGPLPTWIAWYVQHLPHWFHASSAFATLALELGLVWMLFLPRRWRLLCFLIVTPWELGIILTANYTFLNYLVLTLGFLLLDDRFLLCFFPQRWKKFVVAEATPKQSEVQSSGSVLRRCRIARLSVTSFVLGWIFYATTAELIWMFSTIPLPTGPVAALEPFRIANRYGLFGIMTRGRYEIEFQGSADGKIWVAYPFRYKPQDLSAPPGIYAPYQPRFDWNLWFASLGSWQDYPIVPNTEVRLLSNNSDVLNLFRSNPFPNKPPHEVRVVIWQYWFTTMSEKRATGLWWRRQFLGLYAPTIARDPDWHDSWHRRSHGWSTRVNAGAITATSVFSASHPRQRRLRGMIAAHAMHASTWWSGRGANIDIARRCDDRGHISRRSDLRPIPQGAAPGFAGLFTVDLPLTVKTGQEFNIVVRRISKRLPPIPQGPPLHRFLIALHSPDAPY